jgi:glyoxylase-like metal-dependent hydrolase (beta-lactamase superfamily II)
MRRFLLIAAIVGLNTLMVSAHASLIEGNNSKQQNFKLEKVAGNVHVLFGRGGNIGVSYGTDGLMTIDTQFANIVPQIKAELAKLGSDKPRFVFNTHFHGDHTGGNVLFGADALIIAHDNVLKRLMSKVNRMGKPQEPIAKPGRPTITFGKSLSIHMNGERVKAVHFPHGHTDGDTVIFFTGSNVVHLGDDFFVGRFPFVDLNSGGSVPGLVKNIGKLLEIIPVDAKLIPGHGPVSTIDDLKDYHAMLVETTLIVRKHMKAGKSLEEIKKAGLPAKYKEAGSGFIKQDAWIETIFKSYSPKMKK